MVDEFVGDDVKLESHVFRGGHWSVEIEIGKVIPWEVAPGVLIVELKRSLAVRRSAVGVLLLPGKSMRSPPWSFWCGIPPLFVGICCNRCGHMWRVFVVGPVLCG